MPVVLNAIENPIEGIKADNGSDEKSDNVLSSRTLLK
jgi:hypothetical protein